MEQPEWLSRAITAFLRDWPYRQLDPTGGLTGSRLGDYPLAMDFDPIT
jgi:hypothetical protein